jgi:hypothetical protein
MHIAYSALKKTPQPATKQVATEQLSTRFKAYQAACNKYSKEIAAIQQYIPGWAPALPGQ